MKQILLTCIALMLGAVGLTAQIVYDNAEDITLRWAEDFGDGVYNGRVANPADQDPLDINSSTMVNSYTKSGEHSFSLLIALGDTIDLSVNNQFTVQVNSPISSKFIFKIEGDGEAIEKWQNIAVTDTWIEYTFDFSAASEFTTISKFILFFDAGVTESADTFLFDNIVAGPAGPCTGTVADPLVVDDFECQRNGTIGQPGFADIVAIANPDASGINTSAMVGQYTDANGPWQAMVYDYITPEDFPITREESSIVSFKVWSPKAGNLLVKLEGGTSPAVEVSNAVSELNTWVEYTVDFSDQIGASHQKLVLFFNAGVEPDSGDVYFLDDVVLSAAATGSVLEDFEDGAAMDWSSLGDPAVFGMFNGVVGNPATDDVNESANVGCYSKGSSQFGGLKATLPIGFTLEQFPQLNLQVYAPAGATSIKMSLFSPTQGLKGVTVDISETEKWEALSFIFSDFVAITDFERLELVFDENLATQDNWYFDNLTQGQGTVDPCEGTVPIATIVDDFGCQRNVAIAVGADRIEVLDNPVSGGVNPDPLDKVAKYTDPQDAWSAIVYDYGQPIDLSLNNQLNVKIYSSAIVPILFKLEDGAAAAEVFMDVQVVDEWVNYVIDFSSAPEGNKKLVLFMNAGVEHGTDDIYYVDDIQWKRSPFTDCVMDFETDETTFTDWNYFGGADETVFEVLDNPNTGGINESANVGVFSEVANGEVWNGMFTDLPAPIAMPTGNKTLTGKFLGPAEAVMVIKLEEGVDGAPGSGDTPASYTTPGEWQELTWDFSANTPDGSQYNRLTLIPNIEFAPEETQLWYFDDIAIADSKCGGTSSIFQTTLDELTMYPNPVTQTLVVDNAEDVHMLRVISVTGTNTATFVKSNQSSIELDLGHLLPGMYILTGYDVKGQLTASGKFVKN